MTEQPTLGINAPEIAFLYADSGLDSQIFSPHVLVYEMNKYLINPEAYRQIDPLFLAASFDRLFKTEWQRE